MAQADSDTISALELAALLSSRLCHDLISPVGAITNGLEVLEEEDDPEMKAHAMDLLQKSAAQASAKLQYARLAFGAVGSAGAELDLGETKAVADGLFAAEKATLDWQLPPGTMEKDRVKLLLNMLLIANAAIPRGGDLAASSEGEGTRVGFRVVARGQAARVPEETRRYLAGRAAGDSLDARSIQPLFTGMVARSLGLTIEAAMAGADFEIRAVPAG